MGWKNLIQCASLAAGLFALSTQTASATPAMADAEFTNQASEAVARIERDDGFSGVILVALGDHVLLRAAAGYADRERQIRNTPDSQFPLDSVTKQFTATAIMLLVQQGKVSLDDPISKYYPASPMTWRNVTIKHLLTHSSGIEDYWVHRRVNYDPDAASNLFRAPGDLFRAVQNDSLEFQPGTGFSYSNAGYALLAEVIERASGRSYRDFLRDEIFTPLGMRSTVFGQIQERSLKGYVRSFPD